MTSRLRIAWVLSVLVLSAFALGVRAQQADPTVDQIYQTARSGQLPQARSMIDQVVRNHPDSGKAHYVRAEIAARQGDAAVARQDLAEAERLSPGLPFARPEAAQALRAQVQALESRGTTTGTSRMGGPGDAAPEPASTAPGLPWGKLLVGAAVVLGVMALVRRRRSAVAGDGMFTSPTAGPVVSSGGMPAPGAAPGMSPQGPYGPGGYPQGGGMGSSLGRGLATGLAVGAGAVAAQEIGHRILHGRDGQVLHDPSQDPGGLSGDLSRFDGPNPDMGGQDFGLQDTGSWDSGGGSDGGDVAGDWDNS